MISGDGSAEEGRTGSHGRTFRVPPSHLSHGPASAMAELKETGARTVLLLGPSRLGDELLREGLIDTLTLFQPVPEPSSAATAGSPCSRADMPCPE